MPQRDDAGIAEDQVERDREQADDGNLVQEQKTLRQKEQSSQSEHPEQDFCQAPSASAAQRGSHIGSAVVGHWPIRLLTALSKQPLRSKHENDEHEGVDHEGAELRHVVFAGHVRDPNSSEARNGR